MTSHPKDIIIVGGSLSGLMHGIMLLKLGHNVRILEAATGDPESHMAGIGAADDVLEFLAENDRVPQPLGIPSECLQSLDRKGKVTVFLKAKRIMTSWDALYYRLRANFDGLRSEYCANPPEPDDMGQGKGSYDCGKKVVRIVVGDGEGNVEVRVADLSTGEETNLKADFVVGADGPNSIVRRTFLPGTEGRSEYAGYVAWRGVVPENEVSLETRRIFQQNVTYFIIPGEHLIVYHIPGAKGSLEDGRRLLNFCWYSNQSSESLAELTTDSDGQRHHLTVPVGKVRHELWENQRKHGYNAKLPGPYKEILDKIPEPFLQVITDRCSSQASFYNGKVRLVGDALTLMRPHIAFSTNQAAFDCLMLKKEMKGEISNAEWESRVVQFGYLHWRRSVWYGEWFQRPLLSSIWSGLRYWVTAANRMLLGRIWK